MIPYGQDINDQDIMNYWGAGVVLVQFDNVWSAYRLTEVLGDDCILRKVDTPGMASEEAPEKIELTRDEFFEQVLLHRPKLGVCYSDDDKSLYHLSWVPSGPDRVKSLRGTDVHVIPLGTVDGEDDIVVVEDDDIASVIILNRLKGEGDSDREWRALKASLTIDPLNDDLQPRHDPRLNDTRNLKLVIKYLNSKAVSFRDAYASAIRTGLSWVAGEHWLKRTEDRAGVHLHAGQVRISKVRIDALGNTRVAVPEDTGKAKSLVCKMMTNAILAANGITEENHGD
jgi:hypothetical protein